MSFVQAGDLVQNKSELSALSNPSLCTALVLHYYRFCNNEHDQL